MRRVHVKEALDRASRVEGVCISLYVHAAPGGRGVRTRIRSQLQQAQRLVAASFGARRAQDLMNSLREALAFGFSNRESGSFAFFHNELETFWTKLASRPDDLVVVSGTFHVKPLLRDLSVTDSIGADLLNAMSTHRLVDRLPEIAQAIAEGRVEHLYVSGTTNIWGTVDRERGVINNVSPVQQSALDDCVLDDLSQMTLERHGQVTVLPDSAMPIDRKALAIVRWTPPGGGRGDPVRAVAQ